MASPDATGPSSSSRSHLRPVQPRLPLRSERGSVSVELAFALPILVFFIVAVVEFGRALNYLNDANQLAANGARYAAVDRNPGGGGASLPDWIRSQADTAEARSGGTEHVPTPAQVEICFPDGGSTVGSPVRVTVRIPFRFMVLGILPDGVVPGPETLSGSATMRIERQPSNYAGGACA